MNVIWHDNIVVHKHRWVYDRNLVYSFIDYLTNVRQGKLRADNIRPYGH